MAYVLKLFDLETTPRLITEELVGRKVSTLKPVIENQIGNIPNFFVVTTQLYDKFIAPLLTQITPKNIEETRRKILELNLPPRLREQLHNAYKSLGRWGDTRVAVRSSVSSPQYGGVSFSGVFPTYLNVRGIDQVILALKNLYASILEPKPLQYLKKHKLKLSDIKLAVMVQHMLLPEVAGIAYAFDPVSHKTDKYTIEAVYGIGDVIINGEINPDIYIVDKHSLQIVEKKINPQFWMHAFLNTSPTSIKDTISKVELAKVWHFTPKLNDEQITQLARLLKQLEEYYSNFTLEWALSGSKFYILQIKGQLKEKTTKLTQAAKNTKSVKFPILSGMVLSPGEAVAKAVVLNEDYADTYTLDQLYELIKGKILVAHRLDQQLQEVLLKAKAAGVILDIGTPRSDAGYFLSELKIPAVGGTYNATRVIPHGATVHLDANSGSVYLIKR